MTKAVPRERPSAQEVLDRWKEIKKTVGMIQAEWRPRSVGEDPCQSFVLDVVSLYPLFLYLARAVVGSLSG